MILAAVNTIESSCPRFEECDKREMYGFDVQRVLVCKCQRSEVLVTEEGFQGVSENCLGFIHGG